jgi:hypothetical protein
LGKNDYSVISDDLPNFHFENFRINSKFGSPSTNSIKLNNNFLFKDNLTINNNYWEFFALASSYQQKYLDIYGPTTEFNVGFSNSILDENSWLTYDYKNNLSQSFDNFKNINNILYLNFNNNSNRFKNFNQMYKFF